MCWPSWNDPLEHALKIQLDSRSRSVVFSTIRKQTKVYVIVRNLAELRIPFNAVAWESLSNEHLKDLSDCPFCCRLSSVAGRQRFRNHLLRVHRRQQQQ